MKARSFSHVGITVSDFNRFVQFYWDVFGCPLVGVADTPPDRVRSFFHVDHVGQTEGAAPSCKIGWVRVPGGAILEIFEFQPQLAAQAIPWNRVGLTHFSFDVRNTRKWYQLPRQQGRGVREQARTIAARAHILFCRDFDGDLIEMIDLGYMHYVLQWLGPLGGFIFRRDVQAGLRPAARILSAELPSEASHRRGAEFAELQPISACALCAVCGKSFRQ